MTTANKEVKDLKVVVKSVVFADHFYILLAISQVSKSSFH
jgi:hypothetical protein